MRAKRRGGLRLLAFITGPSAREKQAIRRENAFATGARGEELLGELLARRCPGIPVLHDRRLRPGRRANIDHIAISASGVYVIDAKRYDARKVEVRKRWFRPHELRIDGRDKTRLVDGLERQVAAVRSSLADVAPEVPVHGCLCFLAPDGFLASPPVPLWRTPSIRGITVTGPRKLAKLLRSAGPIRPEQVRFLAAELARRFPAMPT